MDMGEEEPKPEIKSKTYTHKVELKPSDSLIKEMAEVKAKTEQEKKTQTGLPKPATIAAADSISSAPNHRVPFDIAAIYKNPNEIETVTKQETSGVSNKPVSTRVHSLLILALVYIFLQVGYLLIVVHFFAANGVQTQMSSIQKVVMFAGVMSALASIYLLVGKNEEIIIGIINFFLFLAFFQLIFSVLGFQIVNIAVGSFSIWFMFHVKNKVNELD